MTASSVEFFPCRVQPIGLPRSTANVSSTVSGTSNLSELNIAINRRPPINKIQKVSRNLFGAPDPVEMKNMYQQEAKRQRSYLSERYNLDTRSIITCKDKRAENPTDFQNSTQNTSSLLKKLNTIPILIEQELKQHEQRLQCEEQNLCRTSSEVTPSNMRIVEHTNSSPKASLLSGEDRQKPYPRQLLKESFNVRKSKESSTRNTKFSSIGVISTNSSKLTKNNEVLQIYQSQKAENNACNIDCLEDKPTLCSKTFICNLNKKNQDIKSVEVCDDNRTAVSLRLVVSTKDLS